MGRSTDDGAPPGVKNPPPAPSCGAPSSAERPTFRAFAEALVGERAAFIRGRAKERNRFDLHVATACFAAMPIADVRPRHIGEWHREMQAKRAADRRGDRPLSKSTIERCHALVSVVFGEALRRELVAVNPCVGQKLRMPEGTEATAERWAFLTLAEQRSVLACSAITEWDKRAMQFAWGTGLRQGEQCNLRLSDVHVDGDDPHVVVRFGSPGLSPKSKKTRRVPLFLDGLDGARALIVFAAKVPNPGGLLFPSKTGAVRSVGKPLGRSLRIGERWVNPLHIHLRSAGVVKPFRWHDLRHTCFTSLVIGAWGRAWRLEEIQAMAGHATIAQTQQYAHFGEDALKRAARETSVKAEAVTAVVAATPSPAESAPAPPPRVPEERPSVREMLRGLAKTVIGRAAARVTKAVGEPES